jgi:hypothetical protein
LHFPPEGIDPVFHACTYTESLMPKLGVVPVKRVLAVKLSVLLGDW